MKFLLLVLTIFFVVLYEIEGKVIDNVVGITPGLRAHGARFCTAPNGKKYLITAILWEFTVDGMAAGAEFAVGEILTNTTQTKKGKVWAFVDNADKIYDTYYFIC